MTVEGKVIIFSAPSGSGKSTLIRFLMQQQLPLQFSVSATSRAPRGNEKEGVDYHFITPDQFRWHIEAGHFLEYEEVYPDVLYGTLKSETDRMLSAGKHVVFDVDVVGGCNIKQFYGERALSLFIQPPSIDELRRRLEFRGVDSPERIERRLAKAAYELGFAPRFDAIIRNDVLEQAQAETLRLVRQFINA
jgi:guanylate kinase